MCICVYVYLCICICTREWEKRHTIHFPSPRLLRSSGTRQQQTKIVIRLEFMYTIYDHLFSFCTSSFGNHPLGFPDVFPHFSWRSSLSFPWGLIPGFNLWNVSNWDRWGWLGRIARWKCVWNLARELLWFPKQLRWCVNGSSLSWWYNTCWVLIWSEAVLSVAFWLLWIWLSRAVKGKAGHSVRPSKRPWGRSNQNFHRSGCFAFWHVACPEYPKISW